MVAMVLCGLSFGALCIGPSAETCGPSAETCSTGSGTSVVGTVECLVECLFKDLDGLRATDRESSVEDKEGDPAHSDLTCHLHVLPHGVGVAVPVEETIDGVRR